MSFIEIKFLKHECISILDSSYTQIYHKNVAVIEKFKITSA